jgi:hypothetical protein
MNELSPISAERATELASFGTVVRFDLSYRESDTEHELNLLLLLENGTRQPTSEILFVGLRGLEVHLGASQPFTEEVQVTSVRHHQLENLNYRVSSDQGSFEFRFHCREVYGAPEQRVVPAEQAT